MAATDVVVATGKQNLNITERINTNVRPFPEEVGGLDVPTCRGRGNLRKRKRRKKATRITIICRDNKRKEKKKGTGRYNLFDLPIYKLRRLFPHYFVDRVEDDEK